MVLNLKSSLSSCLDSYRKSWSPNTAQGQSEAHLPGLASAVRGPLAPGGRPGGGEATAELTLLVRAARQVQGSSHLPAALGAQQASDFAAVLAEYGPTCSQLLLLRSRPLVWTMLACIQRREALGHPVCSRLYFKHDN